MSNLLFLAHTETDGSLAPAALEALGAAVQLAGSLPATLVVGLVGAEVEPAARSIAGCGAARFLAVQGSAFAAARYATDAAAAEALCRAAQAEYVFAAGTSRWLRALPGVAHRVEGVADTHITGVSSANGAVVANRWYYRQRMEAVFQRKAKCWFLLLDPGSQPRWQGAAGQPAIETVPVALTPALERTAVVGMRELGTDAQTIRPEAEVLLVAGAGWTKKQADGQPHVKEAEQLILNFLKGARASLGSSKSLVDLGGEGHAVLSFLTHLNQVGQTGSTPRHPKGLATCCHGEEPHTVGWRFIGERRAINLDPNCGWARGKADVLYVADAFAVMSRVNQLLT
jgi:electron transfer flavoprotein alpha subunit